MYGWEYPPNISGGLGIACHAIVKSLTSKNINISLVLPYEALGNDTSTKTLKIIDWYNQKILVNRNHENKRTTIYKINSILTPYSSEADYKKILTSKNKFIPANTTHTSNISELISEFINSHEYSLKSEPFSGHYGDNLFSEVLRYANIAGSFASTIDHDIIHVHDWMTILAGVRAKNLSGKKLVFHVHALETDRSGIHNINKQIFDIEKYGMEEADKIITVSNYTKNIIIQHYGISESKITAIHNGIDKSYYNSQKPSNKNHQTVLFLGRITHQKGPALFVDIAKKVLDQLPDTQFVMAGTGNLLKETIEKAAGLRIGKNIHFTGFLDQETVKKLYNLADVYVMPSVSEPFGLSCLEALSYDTPVVISKQSGVSEALRNVLCADFWDVNEMSAKILALLKYKALGTELLYNAKKEMSHLTWDKAGDEIINLYRRCTEW